MHVSTADEKSRLFPLYKRTLKYAIECINDEECMEVTLQHLHIVQRILVVNIRPKWQE